jgi:signal peptide peptidase SppA
MSRVLEYLKTVPWAITEEALGTICAIAARDESFVEAIEMDRSEPLRFTRTATVRDGSAIIPITGSIFRRANIFTEISGATSTEVLAQEIGAALRDDSVRRLIFEIDSPGGQVNGTSELAHLIASARGQKPMTSFVSGLGASAAYLLASAADEVVAEKSAILGSLGTVIQVRDFTEANKRRGVHIKTLVSSQSPKKRIDPNTEEGEAEIQQLLDSLSDVFLQSVADNRGVTLETVLSDFGQGGVFVGAEAVEAGLADRVGTLEELLAESLQKSSRRHTSVAASSTPAASGGGDVSQPTGVNPMKKDQPDTTAAAQQPTIDRAFLNANHASLVTEIKAEGAQAERDRITAISELPGSEELKATCVAEGLEPGAAAQRILEAQKVAEQAKADAHLKDRAGAEDGVDAPKPSGSNAGTDETQQTVARALAVHRSLKGKKATA